LLSSTSKLLVAELLRLTTLLQRAATPNDVMAAIQGDPAHPLRFVFRDLASEREWAARLAWLVNRTRLEHGMPLLFTDQPVVMPDDEGTRYDVDDILEARYQRHRALTAAMESLTDTYAVHWPAIVEAHGDTVARQLLSLLEWARRKAM
jgi:hypothetical protein